MSAQPEIRKQKVRKSVNLARAVRISGDGDQEGRHLAKKRGAGLGDAGEAGVPAAQQAVQRRLEIREREPGAELRDTSRHR